MADGTTVTRTIACDVLVSNGRESVSGRSIMGLLMLAAAKGEEISISASGSDAATALDALCALVVDGFGEDRGPMA